MNILKKILAFICLLLIPIALTTAQGQPKITQSEDHVISFGNNLAVIGASSQIFQSILNYPIADTRGCLISFVPAKNLNNLLCIGYHHKTSNWRTQAILGDSIPFLYF